ncbi:OLC1v1028520C1 [Oldenlandia corymbosa var. corymbosa]|nr:OLC1v1028520C1 [Oldenlandia corymbosa var. corymbosa]
MVSTLDSSFMSLGMKDASLDKNIIEAEGISNSDAALLSGVPKDIFESVKVPAEASDKSELRTFQENTKSINSKWKGFSLPLLDLHKDHDIDSLPSPTRGGGPSSFPSDKGIAVGNGLLKPEWPVPRVVLDRETVPLHPYETDAVKAVSSYQQKFGRSSFFMNDRLPSPTPSEEGDTGEGDVGEEVSSSSNMHMNPVSTPLVGLSNISSAPKMDITSGRGLIGALSNANYGSNPSLKPSSVKSRDPRLRLISQEQKVDSAGGMINSKKQKAIEDLASSGPALKRHKNEQTEMNIVQTVSGTGGWLEDRGIGGLGETNRSHESKRSVNDPRRRPEFAVTGVSSTSSIPNITSNSNVKLPGTSSIPTTSLQSLLQDIAVNPSMWMNILKMEQHKSVTPSQTMTQPIMLNSHAGPVPSTSVVASRPPALGEKVAVINPTTPHIPSVEELGKVRMKPRDPRRILHSSTAQRGGNMELNQTLNKTNTSNTPGTMGITNIQGLDDPLDNKNMASHSIALPDITRQFTKNLKNIADMFSVSQTTSPQPVVPKSTSPPPVLESGNVQNVPGQDGQVTSGSAQLQNDWNDVEHLFEGFDDQQKAAIHKERARRLEEQRKMFAKRKLCLVLDLDHTLLNSAKAWGFYFLKQCLICKHHISNFLEWYHNRSPFVFQFAEVDVMHDEMLRKKEELDREKSHRHLFRFPHMSMWTKLRPGIWNFLEKASKLYELHLYTMGNKLYATEMAKLLDPKGELFAGRVISRGDDGDLLDGDERVPKIKDLEGVMGMESSVVIIDDSVRVWPHNKLNLIVVERYIYFPCSRRQFGLPGPSLLEIDHDERAEDGTLAASLAVIERIHQMFFEHQSLDEADVRNILASEQRKILGGCRILFSRVFPVGEVNPHLHPLWQTAEQFGAICTTSIDDKVTHVVANSLGTDKVNWALSTGRFVVHPGWVEASALLYRRANEQDFAIKP